MKLKKLWLGLAVALGVVLTGQQQAQAATNVVPEESTYFTNGQSVAIFSDPELQSNTGRTLDPSITAWKSFNYAVADNGTVTAVDLGGGQWVTPLEFIKNNTESRLSAFEVYTDKNDIKIYSDPITMAHVIGTLDNNIHNWHVTHVGYINMGLSISRVDLGDNQWVFVGPTTGAVIIRNAYYFDQGTKLYDQNGHLTQPITDLGAYRVFDTKKIKDTLYVRLGNDQQWAKLSDGTFN